MKSRKIAIATPVDPNNFGNRLQNYAVHEICKKMGLQPMTLVSRPQCKKILLLSIISKFKLHICFTAQRKAKLLKMAKGIRFTKKYIGIKYLYNKKQYRRITDIYEFGGIGGDQVLSKYWSERVDFCGYSMLDAHKKICFAPSIGKEQLSPEEERQLYNIIKDVERVGVREISGKNILENLLKKQCQVVLDPVLMLKAEEWHQISKAVHNVPENYILKYMFTHENEYNAAVSDFSQTLESEVIDIMDSSQLKYYAIDPGEMVHLIEKATLVCTDSYHGVLMSMILHKPFVLFDRKTSGDSAMSTRFDTINELFNIKHRYYGNVKTEELSNCIEDFDEKVMMAQKETWEYYNSIVN